VIGGFRIVGELGRGAFARVYLAEQTDLANRLVALKVSRAEGEEPQLLARLQHTHIVPIHSVHDDHETGLRLMCMPYLGGANLAQVLEAAGGDPAERKGGRSLVAALDEVSQRYHSQTADRRSGPRATGGSLFAGGSLDARSLGLAPKADEAPSLDTPRPSLSQASLGRASLERLQSLWGRITRGRSTGSSVVGRSLDDRDFDQPARQFLRAANTIQAAVWIIARLAEGLEHAHSRGLLHRDLKPSNVLIAGDGTPMLLDFNLSTPSRARSAEDGERAMLGGTLPYMAPEHLDAFNPQGVTPPEAVDERSDIYALGLILFEMLAGEHPFPEPQRKPLLETIRILTDLRRRPPSLRKMNPRVPPSLDAIVARCVAFDPAKRYVRARDLAEDLNRFLDDQPLKHISEPSIRERCAKWARRNPRLCGNSSVAAFAALLIISLGGMIGLLHANAQNLTARLRLQLFRNDAAECFFLLRIAGGPPEHLRRGIELAQKTLDQEHIGRDGQWRSDSWAWRLTAREQTSVREQTSDLILLSARARVYLARRLGTRSDVIAAEEWAVRWLDRAERLEPEPSAALYGERASHLEDLGRSDFAARDRAHEAELPPRTARDFALRGDSYLGVGDLTRAEESLRQAVELDPRSFWAWFALGHCHFEQGRPIDAAGDFAACIAIEPKFAWPHFNRGLSLARAGRLQAAVGEYKQALKANPRFAEAWVNQALANLELGRLAAADRSMAEAYALGRREPAVLAAWAEIKARRGDRNDAESLFDRLLEESPKDPMLLTARGVFRVASNPDGARADLRRALAIDPKNARAHYGLALALRTTDLKAALGEAEAALRIDPGFLDALQARAILRARLGDMGAVGDAERLSQTPSPHRLYNAACALSLLVKTAGEPRLIARAVDLLDQALDSGFPAERAEADADLDPVRSSPAYRAVMDKPRAVVPDAE
jgi:serine/threonine protein kinase/tetratricopeptide (TPR) repeat protein